MATVRTLLEGALRLAGVLGSGEAMKADEARDALQALNDLIESLNLQHLTNPRGVVRFDGTCTPALAVHTIGAGGTFDTTRPVVIERATVTLDGLEQPLEVVDSDEWSDIPDKTRTGLPETLYYEDGYPLGSVHLYPVPDRAYSVALWAWDSLPTYSSINATLSLPPGYARMLRYNLAVELAPEFGFEVRPSVALGAAESLAAIKRANQSAPVLTGDLTIRPGSPRLSSFLGG